MHGRGALRVGLDCGIVPLSPNLRPLHDELVERVRIPLFSRLLLSTLIDLVRCGLGPSLVWCLLFLDSIPLIPDDAMSSGSKECEFRSLFWFFMRCFSRCLSSLPRSSLSQFTPINGIRIELSRTFWFSSI